MTLKLKLMTLILKALKRSDGVFGGVISPVRDGHIIVVCNGQQFRITITEEKWGPGV